MPNTNEMSGGRLVERSAQLWDESMPTFRRYIESPAVSPQYRPNWESEGHIDAAAKLVLDWVEGQKQYVPGLSVELFRSEGKTPFLYIDVPASNSAPVKEGEIATPQILLYGHIDKQPEMLPWREGLEPFKAVQEGDLLYGRGGADDGYAVFAAIKALRLNVEQGIPNPHTGIIIEASEESGSPDLDHYFGLLKERIGKPETVMILDSGAGNYERPWITDGLRGIVAGTLKVEVLTEGVHSGSAGGIVPSAFRIARRLLERVEDSETGEILLSEFHVPISDADREAAEKTAAALGDTVFSEFPFAGDTKPVTTNPAQLLINKGLKPALTVVAANGLPPIEGAGNVHLPKHELRLSMRIPPGVDTEVAGRALKRVLEENPPYDSIVEFELGHGANGWRAPKSPEWLAASVQSASEECFGAEAGSMWEGGTIPLANDVQRSVPEANFIVTGVLGPHSNAHGPNEFLHVPYTHRLTAFVSRVIASHVNRAPVGGTGETPFAEF